LVRCPSLVIRSREDLDAARRCREIDGKLTFQAQQPLRVTANDLPYLERVTGSVISVGSSPLTEITLPELRDVGAGGADDVLEIGFDQSSLSRISLPELRAVHGGLGIVSLGGLTELELGQLAVVEGDHMLSQLPLLTALTIPSQVHTGKTTDFEYLCMLPLDALPDTSTIATDDKILNGLACCLESSLGCPSHLCQCE
jgi:hypothetical protein